MTKTATIPRIGHIQSSLFLNEVITKIEFLRQSIIVNKDSANKVMPGDSGGPLMCKYKDHWYILGVTSGGNKRIALIQSIIKSLDWIESFNSTAQIRDCPQNDFSNLE